MMSPKTNCIFNPLPEVKLVTVVTHGQTIENHLGIHQGWTIEGTPSEAGKKQNEAVVNLLKDISYDEIYSSPLNRCKTLADKIKLNCPEANLIFTDEIRAKKSGYYEGKTRNLVFEYLKKHNFKLSTFKPKNGESTEEQQRRVIRFFEDIKYTKGRNILIVTHGGIATTWNLHHHKRGLEYYKLFQPLQGSVTLFRITQHEYYGETYREYELLLNNYVDHLKNIKSTYLGGR